MGDRLLDFVGDLANATLGGKRWDGWEMTYHHLKTQEYKEMCPWQCCIGSALRSADCAVGDFETKSRMKGRNVTSIGINACTIVWAHTLEFFAVNRIPTSGSL